MKEIVLNGYETNIAPYDAIELGTFDSYGEEQLQIVKAQNWENLNVIATFNPPNKKPVQVVVDSVTGIIKVPKEATADLYGVGTIVFVGLADGVQRISTDVRYNVRKHSNANGTEPAEPTPSVVQQILTEAQNANVNSAKAKKLATDAKDIAQSVRDDADNGKFNGKDGAKGDKGDVGTTPQLKIGEDNLWNVSYDNGATWVSLGVKATGAAGKDGEDGLTPYIGENGNWWVGATDTGVSAKGPKGETGAKGADGVSPTASVTQTDDGAKFTVTDASGTTTAMIRNGTDGKDGAPGAAGKDAVVDATLTQDGQAADAKVTGEKISQLKEDTAALKNRQNVLVGSETDNPISCNDAYSAPLCGLTVYGKSTQDGTPTHDAPVPIVSAGDGGSVTVKVTGKNLFYKQEFQNYFINSAANSVGLAVGNVSSVLQVVTGAKYYVTRNKIGTKFRVAVVDELPTKSSVVRPSSAINADSKRQVEISATSKYMVIQCEDEEAFSELMVSLDSSTAYSPYREQLLTLPTPNGLPGIPVTSGGNYTDQNGQQWVCDEVDLERGVKVQRVNIVDLSTCVITGTTNLVVTKRLAIRLPLKGKNYTVKSLCNRLPYLVSFTSDTIHFYVDTNNVQVFIPIDAKKPEEGEYILFYVLDAPIETPLTPAEIAAYKALTAYAPDTVVQASDGAGIKLDYQRDVNLVVKNLEDAIASMTTT